MGSIHLGKYTIVPWILWDGSPKNDGPNPPNFASFISQQLPGFHGFGTKGHSRHLQRQHDIHPPPSTHHSWHPWRPPPVTEPSPSTSKRRMISSASKVINEWAVFFLVGGLKNMLVKMEIFTQVGVKIENISNHHLVMLGTPATPRKIKIFDLKITGLKRKNIWTKQTSIFCFHACLFQGVMLENLATLYGMPKNKTLKRGFSKKKTWKQTV